MQQATLDLTVGQIVSAMAHSLLDKESSVESLTALYELDISIAIALKPCNSAKGIDTSCIELKCDFHIAAANDAALLYERTGKLEWARVWHDQATEAAEVFMSPIKELLLKITQSREMPHLNCSL